MTKKKGTKRLESEKPSKISKYKEIYAKYGLTLKEINKTGCSIITTNAPIKRSK